MQINKSALSSSAAQKRERKILVKSCKVLKYFFSFGNINVKHLVWLMWLIVNNLFVATGFSVMELQKNVSISITLHGV